MDIQLKGTVVEVLSGKEFTDKKRRVRIKLEGAEYPDRHIRIVCDTLNLDDEVILCGASVKPSTKDN